MNLSEKVQDIKSHINKSGDENLISEIIDLLEEVCLHIDRQSDPDLWHPKGLC